MAARDYAVGLMVDFVYCGLRASFKLYNVYAMVMCRKRYAEMTQLCSNVFTLLKFYSLSLNINMKFGIWVHCTKMTVSWLCKESFFRSLNAVVSKFGRTGREEAFLVSHISKCISIAWWVTGEIFALRMLPHCAGVTFWGIFPRGESPGECLQWYFLE